MSLQDSIDKAKAFHRAASDQRKKKALNNKATPSGVALLWKDFVSQAGWGENFAVLDASTFNMLRGFVKLYATEKGSQWIYNTLQAVATKWELLRSREHFTDKNGIKWTVPAAPDLRTFLICKKSFLAALQEFSSPVKVSDREPTPSRPPRRERRSPTEEEMADAFRAAWEEADS